MPIKLSGAIRKFELVKIVEWNIMSYIEDTLSKTAKWIWYPENRTLPCTFMHFRKEFTLGEDCWEGLGKIAADSRYRLYVNGNFVQRGPAPFDPRYQELDPVNITPYLRAGKNVIGIIVSYFGYGEGTYIPGYPGLLFDLRLKTRSEEINLSTDSSWKVYKSKSWKSGQYQKNFMRSLQEEFDARQFPYGWDSAGFDDSNWKFAEELPVPEGKSLICQASTHYLHGFRVTTSVEKPKPGSFMGEAQYLSDHNDYYLTDRAIPMLTEKKESAVEVVKYGYIHWKEDPNEYFENFVKDAFTEEVIEVPKQKELFPIHLDVYENTSSVVVLKLKEEMTGYPYVNITAPEGTVCEIIFSEIMHLEKQDNLLPHTFNTGIMLGQWVRLTTKDGANYFEAVEYDGFLYLAVLVRGKTGKAILTDAGVMRRSYPFKGDADFKCSDEKVNRVYGAGINTLINLNQDTCVDNMSRERQHYTKEVGYAKTGLYYAFGEYQMSDYAIRKFCRGQSPQGWFMDAFPGYDRCVRLWQNTLGLNYNGIVPDEIVYTPFEIYRHCLYSGDLTLAKDLFGKILKMLKWFESIEDENGILPVTNIPLMRVWVDTLGFEQQRHKILPFNLEYYACLNHWVPSLAELVGDKETIEKCKERAKRLKGELFKMFWDPDQHMFIDNLPFLDEDKKIRTHDRTLSLALYYDVIPAEYIEFNLDILESNPEYMGVSHPPLTFWRWFALSKYGREMAVLKDFRNKWANLKAVVEGNTCPESWEGQSRCQNSAPPVLAIYQWILGVNPIKPGFEVYEVAPRIGDLKEVSGSVKTPGDDIYIEISQNDHGYRYTLILPANKEAVIKLPVGLSRVQCENIKVKSEIENFIGKNEINIKPPETTRIVLNGNQ